MLGVPVQISHLQHSIVLQPLQSSRPLAVHCGQGIRSFVSSNIFLVFNAFLCCTISRHQLWPQPPAVANTLPLRRRRIFVSCRCPVTTSNNHALIVECPRGIKPPINIMPREHSTAAWPVIQRLCHIPPLCEARLANASVRGKRTKAWRSVSKHESPAVYFSARGKDSSTVRVGKEGEEEGEDTLSVLSYVLQVDTGENKHGKYCTVRQHHTGHIKKSQDCPQK